MKTQKLVINLKSGNRKTGEIPVSMSEESSCPATCPFINKGCYAKVGHIVPWWRKVANKFISLKQFYSIISFLPDGQLWRHNQAGDLFHNEGKIDKNFLNRLTKANKGKRGFTYTHHIPSKHNLEALTKANNEGFTVNLSANNVDEAVEYKKTGLPVVTVIESTDKRKQFKHNGESFITCPHTYRPSIQCVNCGICQLKDRKYIVAFPAHGVAKKRIDSVINQ
jgi:hypothetical protein